MTKPIKPNSIELTPCQVSEQQLWEAFKTADKKEVPVKVGDLVIKEGDGRLNAPGDHLPTIMCEGQEKTLLASPVIQDLYRILRGDKKRRESGAKHKFRLLSVNEDKKILTREEINWLMKRNGSHPLRLGDIARLYPKARIRGEGPILKDLAAEPIITAEHNTTLADAYIDPGGDLIVSHFYSQELRSYAPAVTQMMTNRRSGHDNPACHDPSQAFGIDECAPDSLGMDTDTLLSLGRLDAYFDVTPGLHPPVYDHKKVLVSRSELLRRLAAEKSLKSFVKPIMETKRIRARTRVRPPKRKEVQVGLSINLEDPEAARCVLAWLNSQFPALKCDPNNKDHLAYYLGKRPDRVFLKRDASDIRYGKPHEIELRRVLLAILDDKTLYQGYDAAKASNPALFNRHAKAIQKELNKYEWIDRKDKGPSLYFAARISPENIKKVIFVINHIDAQSYQPRGNAWMKDPIGPEAGDYQHQGETEPIFLRFWRYAETETLTPEKALLGDHLNAHPVKHPGSKQRQIKVSRSYGSGGTFLRPKKYDEPAGMMYRGGSASSEIADWGSRVYIFPYLEAVPGEKETQGRKKTAAEFKPDSGYQVIIEGQDNDFLMTARLLSMNGEKGSGSLNTSGHARFRAMDDNSAEGERDRTKVNTLAYTDRQIEYHENYILGKITAGYIETFISRNNERDLQYPSSSGGYRLKLGIDKPGIIFWDPAALDGYIINPIAMFKTPTLPQMSFEFISAPEEDNQHRYNLGFDLAELDFGLMTTHFKTMIGARTGVDWSGAFADWSDRGVGIFINPRAYMALQKEIFELQIGVQTYCSTNNALASPENECGDLSGFLRAQVKFRSF